MDGAVCPHRRTHGPTRGCGKQKGLARGQNQRPALPALLHFNTELGVSENSDFVPSLPCCYECVFVKVGKIKYD